MKRCTCSATILRLVVAFKCFLTVIKGPNMCQENIPHIFQVPPPAWTVDTTCIRSMGSCCWNQIMTLQFAQFGRNHIKSYLTRQCFSSLQLSRFTDPVSSFTRPVSTVFADLTHHLGIVQPLCTFFCFSHHSVLTLYLHDFMFCAVAMHLAVWTVAWMCGCTGVPSKMYSEFIEDQCSVLNLICEVCEKWEDKGLSVLSSPNSLTFWNNVIVRVQYGKRRCLLRTHILPSDSEVALIHCETGALASGPQALASVLVKRWALLSQPAP